MSPTRRIFAGTLTIGLGMVIAKGMGIAKELVVAATFGRGDDLEIFILAVLLPQAIAVMVGSSLQGALIPSLAKSESSGGRAASDTLFSGILSLAVPALMTLAVLVALNGSWLVPLMGGGFSPDKQAMTIALLQLSAPIILLSAVSIMLSALLHGRERFLIAAMIPALTPFLMLVSCLTFSATAWTLVTCVLIGQSLELLLLSWVVYRAGHRWRTRLPTLTGEQRVVLWQWFPLFAAVAVHGGVAVVDQIMAAHLISGSVSALFYAQKLVLLPADLLLGLVAPAFFSVLAKCSATSSVEETEAISAWWRRRLLWMTAGIAVTITLGAHELVRFTLERGSFSALDTANVALLVAILAPALPWYVVGALGARMISINGGNARLLWIACTNLSLSVIGNLLLAPLLGTVGIALTMTGVYAISFFQIEWHTFCLKQLNLDKRAAT
jgi:putative peptidoglycan lipid II flippase